MILEPLNAKMPVEILISHTGNVMVLHQGKTGVRYSWVQFDPYTSRLQFITTEGEIQDLGMNIPETFHESLQNTREIFMMEIGKDFSRGEPYLIKFSPLVDVTEDIEF